MDLHNIKIQQSKSGMGKIRPRDQMQLIWLFDLARQTCPYYVINLYNDYTFAICNALISPIDGVEIA